jgi:hypothetical protein
VKGRQHHAAVLVGALFLIVLAAMSVMATDSYLARFGPSVLRFAAAPKPYKWPKPIGVETNVPATPAMDTPNLATNDSASAASTLAAQSTTNVIVDAPGPETLVAESLPAPEVQNPLLSTNTIPAGNLLPVTPQVLADYFKANLDSSYHAATNGVGSEIPFIPPILKVVPPSSEATYKVQ